MIVLEAGFDADPDVEQAVFMRLCQNAPDDPKLGNVVNDNGWKVYTLSGWQSLGLTLDDLSSKADLSTLQTLSSELSAKADVSALNTVEAKIPAKTS